MPELRHNERLRLRMSTRKGRSEVCCAPKREKENRNVTDYEKLKYAILNKKQVTAFYDGYYSVNGGVKFLKSPVE